MYLVTVLGNLLIVLANITDTHLHTPVYFFLSNLSLVDVFLSSTTVPKMLVNLWTQPGHPLCMPCPDVCLPPVRDHRQLPPGHDGH